MQRNCTLEGAAELIEAISLIIFREMAKTMAYAVHMETVRKIVSFAFN